MVDQNIKALVNYAVNKGLISALDKTYCANKLLEILCKDDFDETIDAAEGSLEDILGALLDYAVAKGLISNDVTSRDLFDTKLMGALVPAPSAVIANFRAMYQLSPESATRYYYKLSGDSDYIRRYRVERDIKWKAQSEYGELDITINLSKPEKSPEEIAKAKLAKQGGYPKCLLCPQNEGYAGRSNHPARQNHRIIPVEICGEEWGLQYSPYVYYNEHCILFNKRHVPMKIDKAAFEKLMDFVRQFPHYFIGSNADLPIVGGSILSHEHFQGGNYEFAMAKAQGEKTYIIKGFEDIIVQKVKWPMSVIRLRGENSDRLCELADHILTVWRGYSDQECFIFAETDGEKHNTITPIARRRGKMFELDLVLRNNITTAEHPLGVFHPHTELHHIKKENIGLIEVMGLAVLPGRLKTELELLKKAMLAGRNIAEDETLSKHAEWANEIASRRSITAENIDEIINDEVGEVFKQVLEHAGVFKRDDNGARGFDRFVEECGGKFD